MVSSTIRHPPWPEERDDGVYSHRGQNVPTMNREKCLFPLAAPNVLHAGQFSPLNLLQGSFIRHGPYTPDRIPASQHPSAWFPDPLR